MISNFSKNWDFILGEPALYSTLINELYTRIAKVKATLANYLQLGLELPLERWNLVRCHA
jgi:hypothetical protein